ncbi:MAG: hypothetical protein ACFFAS_06850 [Promethearchaeota archaeon]
MEQKKKKTFLGCNDNEGFQNVGKAKICNTLFENLLNAKCHNYEKIKKKPSKSIFSYDIVEDLILYDSELSENKYSFAIIESEDYSPFLTPLKKGLETGLLHAFSLQINIPESKKYYIILSFKSKEKANLHKNFEAIKITIGRTIPAEVIFLKYDALEYRFLKANTYFDKNLKISNVLIEKKEDINENTSIFVIDNRNSRMNVLDLYEIQLDKISKGERFFSILRSTFKNLSIKGTIIFNFKEVHKIMSCATYLVNIFEFSLITKRTKEGMLTSLERELEDFNNAKILCSLQRISPKNTKIIQKLIWRQSISKNFIQLDKIKLNILERSLI